MDKKDKWEELFAEASREVQRWRRQHKKATLTDIEETVDRKLAKMRAQMVEDLAMASEQADLTAIPREERPKCPVCGRPVVANGRQSRQLTTDHEQEVSLSRSKAYCRQCGLSFFPSG